MTTLQETLIESYTSSASESLTVSSDGSEPASPSPKDTSDNTLKSPIGMESYFNPGGLSRTNSIYTLSRVSFSNQLAQLTSLNLPDASSLSSSVSAIPTASSATKALANAAVQIQRWIQKAAEVLGGLDAEDDVEWAAAGGREGLGEVDTAIGKFESLVQVYVVAIEDLQKRDDISKVPKEELKVVVDTMDVVLEAWENVRKLLRGVKQQVELAMEWEELWNTVLGDIGLEIENLDRLVYEMEEKRHKTMSSTSAAESFIAIDMQELETIVEESPMNSTAVNKVSHRFSLPPAFPASSPLESPIMSAPQDNENVLALFARMQPLRASLDFLPMRLSSFHIRAQTILPTACDELTARRVSLEKKWKKLSGDAEALRRELGEDRWIIAFRTTARQIEKMCESVERSVAKLQEAIDSGAQHNNPPALVSRIEAYEAKKRHYGSAIPRVLSLIEKGVKDRLTHNGEVIRLHADTKARCSTLEADLRDMDLSLDDLNMRKSQQLRDSMSSIVSNDISIAGSTVNTPSSSPASSVVMGPASGKKSFISTPELNNSNRRGSSSTNSTPSSHPSTARRTSSFNRNPSLSRSFQTSSPNLRDSSPSSTHKSSSATPTPGARPKRPSMQTSDKPRWNSSPRIEHVDIGHNFRSVSLATPPAKSIYSNRNSRASSSNLLLSSPLGRECSASPAPSASSVRNPRAKPMNGSNTSLAMRPRRQTSPSPARYAQGSAKEKGITEPSRSRPRSVYASQRTTSSRLAAPPEDYSDDFPQGENEGLGLDIGGDSDKYLGGGSPTSSSPKLTRPATAMAGSGVSASGRRSSLLPMPKTRVISGRESVVGVRGGGTGERAWR